MIEDGNSRVTVSPAFERWLAGNHFIQHNAQTEDVRALIDCVAFSLLRRHVPGRANDRAGVGFGDRYRDCFWIC